MVSNLGRIKRVDRRVIKKNGDAITYKSALLNPSLNMHGYYHCGLTINGKCKTFTVHRLVAIAFIENELKKPTVNHIDGDKLNNHKDNLEWNTVKENTRHSIRNELHPNFAIKQLDLDGNLICIHIKP